MEEGSGFEVEVEWAGFDTGEKTWEDLAKLWAAAPQFVKSELRKLRLKRGVRTKLKRQCGITLLCGFPMMLSKNRLGMFLRCYFAECMSCGVIVDEADDTNIIPVAVKSFLRCLFFGRRMFIWVFVWLGP